MTLNVADIFFWMNFKLQNIYFFERREYLSFILKPSFTHLQFKFENTLAIDKYLV